MFLRAVTSQLHLFIRNSDRLITSFYVQCYLLCKVTLKSGGKWLGMKGACRVAAYFKISTISNKFTTIKMR